MHGKLDTFRAKQKQESTKSSDHVVCVASNRLEDTNDWFSLQGHLPNFFGFDYNERDVYIFMEYVDGYQMYEYFKSLRQLMIENNSIDAAISHFDQPGVFFFIKQLVSCAIDRRNNRNWLPNQF